MTAGPLTATTRPIYWQPACRCRGVSYSLGVTREFRADGKACGPKGDRRAASIVRVETIPGPSCDGCGRAWVDLMKQRQGAA